MLIVSPLQLISPLTGVDENWTGSWLVSLGGSKFDASCRKQGTTIEIRSAVFSIDDGGLYTFGPTQDNEITSRPLITSDFSLVYQGGFDNLFISHFYFFPGSFIAFNYSGYSLSKTIDQLYSPQAPAEKTVREPAQVTQYIRSDNTTVVSIIVVNGPNDDIHLQAIEARPNGQIYEHPYSAVPFTSDSNDGYIDTSNAYAATCAVGDRGDFVISYRVSSISPSGTFMYFWRATVKNHVITIGPRLLCADLDGRPKAIVGTYSGDTFFVQYQDPNTDVVRQVLGRLDGVDSLVFGTPENYDTSTAGAPYPLNGLDAAVWERGNNTVISAVRRVDLGLTSVDIVRSNIDLPSLSFTTSLVDRQNLALDPQGSISASRDDVNNLAVFGFFGDGVLTDLNTVYTIAAHTSAVFIEQVTGLSLVLTSGDPIELKNSLGFALELTSRAPIDLESSIGFGLKLRAVPSDSVYIDLSVGLGPQLEGISASKVDLQVSLGLGLKLRAVPSDSVYIDLSIGLSTQLVGISADKVDLQVCLGLALSLRAVPTSNVDLSIGVGLDVKLLSSIPVTLLIGLGISVELTAAIFPVATATISIGSLLALKFNSSINHASLQIGLATGNIFKSNFIKLANLPLALQYAFSLSTKKRYIGNLKIALALAPKFGGVLAPQMTLRLSLGPAANIQAEKPLRSYLRIGLAVRLKLEVGCISSCDICEVPGYSSTGVY